MLNLFIIHSRLFILMNSAKKKSRGNPLDVIDILFQIYFYKIRNYTYTAVCLDISEISEVLP